MTAEKTSENEKCDTSCNLRGLVGYNADLCTAEKKEGGGVVCYMMEVYLY